MIYACDICSKKFDSPQKLGGHKTSHFRNKSQYDSRRGRKRTPEQKQRIKDAVKNLTPEQKRRRIVGYKTFREEEKNKTSYSISGIKLNVTKAFMEEYRKAHPVCQICGKPERKTARNGVYKGNRIQNLCVDHIHGTNRFRGLLCNDCNRKLGWFENNKNEILHYLESSPNG